MFELAGVDGGVTSTREEDLPAYEARIRPRVEPREQITMGFAAEAVAARSARELTGEVLAGWRIPQAVDDTVAVVSELVTNAVTHATSHRIELVLTYGDGLLLVEVRDDSTRPPVLVRDAGDSEGGRGLQLVHALASDWGWLPLDQKRKAVWALMAVRHAEPAVRGHAAALREALDADGVRCAVEIRDAETGLLVLHLKATEDAQVLARWVVGGRSSERPWSARAWDRPGRGAGMCWLYCRRTGIPVFWIGPATSAGTQASMYACETCLAELDAMVRQYVPDVDSG